MYKQARMVRAGICSLPSLPRLSTHSERLIVRVLYVFSVACVPAGFNMTTRKTVVVLSWNVILPDRSRHLWNAVLVGTEYFLLWSTWAF